MEHTGSHVRIDAIVKFVSPVLNMARIPQKRIGGVETKTRRRAIGDGALDEIIFIQRIWISDF